MSPTDVLAPQTNVVPAYVSRHSFIELNGRARAQSLMDPGSWRELVDAFELIESPWLPAQGIAPQSDDGCIVLKGTIAGKPAVVIALEGKFQAGSMGEVSGAKILRLSISRPATRKTARKPPRSCCSKPEAYACRKPIWVSAAIAEVIASVLFLREHAPIITVIAGTVGCFGGMSLVAGLSSYVVMTQEARLGLNGPEVIEQESGIEEFDSSDRALIWAINGGQQRVGMGVADELVTDDVDKIAAGVQRFVKAGLPSYTAASRWSFIASVSRPSTFRGRSIPSA